MKNNQQYFNILNLINNLKIDNNESDKNIIAINSKLKEVSVLIENLRK